LGVPGVFPVARPFLAVPSPHHTSFGRAVGAMGSGSGATQFRRNTMHSTRRNTDRFVAQRLAQLARAITLEITLNQAVPRTDRL